MGKLAFDKAVRGTMFKLEPDQVVLITDKKHPLYDPRVELPIDEGLVRNIMANGVIEPIVVRNVDGKPEVVDGRQRVRCVREANKRLDKLGLVTHRINAIIRNGTEGDLFGVSISANENRQDDTPIGRAEKANRMLIFGRTEEETATAFCVGVQTIRNWIKLLDCSAPVRKAVESGKLSATAACKLAGLPSDEQSEVLGSLKTTTSKATGKPKKPTVAAARKAASKKSGKDAGIRMRTAKEIKQKIKGTRKMNAQYLEALCWVLGDDPDDYAASK